MLAEQPIKTDDLAFLAGGGELGCLVATFDWAATSIGSISTWPQSLKTSVSLILRSQVPIVMLWGGDGVMIYNDAYSVFAGGRHPQLLGSKVREGWPEVADFNDHVMKVVLAGGTLAYRDQELTLNRSGRPEQVWMNLDYSPILDERGQPAGVIAIVVETTEKVAAERWQKSERNRQRQMFEQAPGFMAMMSGPDHVFELTNAAYMQLVGHRDVIGMPVREALPEVTGQGFFELLDQVFTSGEAFVGHALKAELQRTPSAPKEDRFIDLVYQPVRNPGGDIIGIFVQGVDVTDRLVAESALRRSEAQFRTFAEAMPNHVWTASPQGMLDWFNPRVYEYSGTAPGELDGQAWAVIVHPDDVGSAAGKWADALSSGISYETEFRLRRHDGIYRWHIARAVPIRDAGGDIVQWIGTNTDIDDQKQVAQALHESERRLQLSQNAAGIAALELDIATGTVVGSEGFWDLWGLSPRDSVHISVLENIVLPEDKDVRSTAETRKQGSAVPNVEYRIRRPDNGELRWLSRHIDFVHDEAGKPIKMFGVMQDVTDRREAQARQELLTHELEHRIKNILAMVAAIASQTLRNTDIATARATFNERLRALANAHDILNKTRWTSASMRQVIDNTIAAFPVARISVSGPALPINPKMALTLALAVNELGTNALKYGALSTPDGKVTIEWTVTPSIDSDASTLIWRWRETGGPAVTPPTRKGFGRFLIERVFGTDFGGTVRIDYHLDGVECVLTAPQPQLPTSRY
ncbi:PAS domain-containing protein [Mesorhizobium sp. PAMC28654]|uniref:PAS domain-containing sensor histidine kinase n=1 Tax=Mesorhizobium sp. PAMC28654 TaxID=2880934 RepID=UPI001D0ABC8D|nr:PAS domain S-box protein [Mesorhizobium sp. PAMC28654]UDL89559.1 PAS domain-containing protein [Mesorhizobium sp. PAMC28654]